MMAPLPANRVNFEPPFSEVGVDYMSKFHIKSTYQGSTPYPCYLVVFTCFVTRAAHLEIILSDEVEGFLMAIKRMISARGHPQHMYSDNAKYFQRAEKEIAETVDKNIEIIKEFSEWLRFHWHYSVEYHSAGGGVWERMVKARVLQDTFKNVSRYRYNTFCQKVSRYKILLQMYLDTRYF